RVMIAMALLNRPKLLIADEPTTALDVTVQAQILALIADLQKQMGMSVILITHDLGVIAETCDEVAVMYAGRIVERAPVGELFAAPRHAYTRGLLASIPRMDAEPKTPLKTIPGSVPAIENFNSGCRFADRSGMEHTAAQLNERPPFVEVAPDHWVEACPVCAGDSGVGKSAAIPYPSSYDTRSQRNSAPTLGDALAHLEAGAGAGAAASKDSDREERRRLEFGRLAAWARQNGCLIAAETFRQPEAQGAEHRVFFDEDLGCAIKLTNPNRCGMTFVDGEAEAATPTEYLRRWILHNEIFGDQVMFHGVVEGPSGLCLAVRQTWITGDPPTEDEIVNEMRAFGFESCASAHDYYRRSDGMAVLDAHESNLVRGEDGALFAIDVIPVKAGPELLKRMEVSP
ncbi:MAG: hypothetical protein KDK99_03430, partial [Verrucomicrobiales bacterium]|nr:hypothetical protein [Verrucomicrobiales bacterium]